VARKPRAEPVGGTLIGGRYQLVEVAGKGGMATVWRAQLRGDFGFTRPVAVKQMYDHLAEQPVFVDMFVEEARVGAALSHPNIAQAYDFVHEDDNYYLIMEWIDGIDLGSYVRHFTSQERKTPWELVSAVGIGLLRALAAAHERHDPSGEGVPIVHRDVSPHNILLTEKGMVKLIDFGLSLAADRGKETTEPGVVKGKMSYLAPEIVNGKRPSPASDQFAVGSVLWEALVGRKLFEGETDLDVFGKLKNGQVQPLRPLRPDVPNKLISVVTKALAADEDQRHPSVREMARQLGMVLKNSKRAEKDLHRLLGETVAQARQRIELEGIEREYSDTTPIEEPSVQVVAPQKKRGLLHRLPFFGRRRG
jgi:eukaryotic-like serine/threonine-protein kinase